MIIGKIILWGGVAIGFLIVTATLSKLSARSLVHELEKRLDAYQKAQLRLGGSTRGIPYDFRSFDGGTHWYNVEENEGGFVILGAADPEKVAKALALRKIFDRGAPFDTKDPEDLKLLSEAGFTVEHKETPDA